MRRAEIVLVLACFGLLGGSLFPRALLGQKALSTADILFETPPLDASAPPGFRPKNPTLGDPTFQYEPWFEFAIAEVRAGRLPLWNPVAACGMPLIGNAQAALLSPFTALHYLAPGHATRALECLLKILVAALGTYLLARHAGTSAVAALLAAVAFSLCGFQVVWLLYPLASAAAFLPWLWLGVDALVRHRSFAAAAGIAVVNGVQLCCGHPETSFYVALAGGCYFLLRLPAVASGQRRRVLALFLVSQLLGAALAAPQVLPFLEYLGQSSALALRSVLAPEEMHGELSFRDLSLASTLALVVLALLVYAFARRLMQPHRAWLGGVVLALGFGTFVHLGLAKGLFDAIAQLLVPDLFGSPAAGGAGGGYGGPRNYNAYSADYVGVVTLLLALLALFLRGTAVTPPMASAWKVLLVGSFLVVFRVPPFSQWLNLVPPFSVSADSRLLPTVALSGSLLAGTALDQVGARLVARGDATRALIGTVAVLAGGIGGYLSSPLPSHAGWLPTRKAIPETLSRPFGKLVAPRIEEVVRGEVVRVRGFALDDEPVASIVVKLVQGPAAISANATLGLHDPRPDNEALHVYPEFERAGFAADVALTGEMRNGPAQVHVLVTDRQGNQKDLGPRQITLLRSRHLARGALLFLVSLAWLVWFVARGSARAPALLLLVVDLYAFAHGYNPEIELAHYKPPLPELQALTARSPGARLIAPAGVFPENMATKYGIPDVRGDDVMGICAYEALLRALPPSRYGLPLPLDPAGAFAQLLHARFTVLPRHGAPPFPGAVELASTPVAIYERADVTSRVAFVREAVPHPPLARAELSSPAALRKLLGTLARPLEQILLEARGDEAMTMSAPAASGSGRTVITRDLPCRVEIDVESDVKGYLFLGDTYFPGWQASVDGAAAPVRRADIAFRAVSVAAGKHHVVFRYRPWSLSIGLWLAAGAVLVMLAGALRTAGRRAPEPRR
ncbi:MAG: YfhO family protein [Planctomycetota bacterium]